jgi:hypothetical protein
LRITTILNTLRTHDACLPVLPESPDIGITTAPPRAGNRTSMLLYATSVPLSRLRRACERSAYAVLLCSVAASRSAEFRMKFAGLLSLSMLHHATSARSPPDFRQMCRCWSRKGVPSFGLHCATPDHSMQQISNLTITGALCHLYVPGVAFVDRFSNPEGQTAQAQRTPGDQRPTVVFLRVFEPWWLISSPSR